ncbi:uncharacterized protein F4807DRAFT_424105 [Annulohypoxylon truncatum]|uniref:uncharacterized protein n=1 Tax=Annulohypoxylon truncatum TaxID=327061 RepID=UPI002007CA79|nr:uncharacterized protein F4807DRAFT_424105 [Annulohypoxylon truncatum]KAI1210172.1 hypothetical protein F4807DRAFT_424105 [Annulohypoxylon truncatum]
MSDESESDIEDRVASEEDDNLDEIDSEESDSEEANEFLDIEASESDNQSEEDDDLSSDVGEPATFHQFMQLPPELRARVWDFFDPDARERARVFKVIIPNHSLTASTIWEGEFLEDQTAPARAMLATHRESRELALRFYPDMFYIRNGRCGTPYNKERDVVLIHGETQQASRHDIRDILSALGYPKIVAFGAGFDLENDPDFMVLHEYEGRPRNILRCVDEYEFSGQAMEWCVYDTANRYFVKWTEEHSGIPHDVQIMYCWPNFEMFQDLLGKDIPGTNVEPWGVDWLPMIEFHDLERYAKLQVAAATEGEWRDKWSETSSITEEHETEDEYESDGIDDATIDDDEDPSEDGDDLVVVQSDSEEDIASTFNGFSPLENASSEHGGDAIGASNFSSLEPESPGPDASADPHMHESDHGSEHALSDEEPIQKTNRRKRRIISSDDERDDDDEPSGEVKAPSRPNKRSRVILSDSEDEDDEEGDEGAEDNQESEEEEPDESESESESEQPEPVKTKPMSLFEKLRQFRDENPVSPDSGAGSDAGSDSIGNEDFDEGSESRFLDDEVNEDEMLDNGEGDSYEEGDDEW